MTSSLEPPGGPPPRTVAWRVAQDASVAALAALLALLLLGAIGWPWAWISVDVSAAHLPRNEYAARAILEGRLPLWNPYEYTGLPLMATTTGAMLYPPVVVAHALLERHAAFTAIAFFHLFLLFLGTTLYLGRHGLGRLASLFATAVALMPLLVASGACYPNYLAAIVWLPLLLLLLDRAIDGPGWGCIGAFGLAAGMQWLAGYPEYPMDTAVLLGVITVSGRRGPLLRPCLILAAGLALGAAIAALQLLPLAEMVRESYRAKALAGIAAARPPLTLQSVGQGARLLVTGYGVAFLALGGIGASLRPCARRGWLLAFLWCAFALYPPLALLYRLPPWSGSRAPIGWVGLAPLLLGFLAASGSKRLLARPWWWSRVLVVALAAGAVLHGGEALLAFRRLLVDPPEPAGAPAQRAEQLQQLLAGPARGARVLASAERAAGSFLRHGLPSPTGSEPSQLEPQRIAQLLDAVGQHIGVATPRQWATLEARPELAALLGVGIVVGPPARHRGLREAGFVDIGVLPGGDRVYYRPPVPRARLVHRVVVVPDETASLARVVEHAGEAMTTAVIEAGQPLAELAEAPPGAEESATVERDEPERLELAARVASPALLVVRDTEYPGWRATVNGAPAPILRVDHAFRAVALPRGEHRVVFVYAPASLRAGIAVSGVGLVVALALLLLGRRRSRCPSRGATV